MAARIFRLIAGASTNLEQIQFNGGNLTAFEVVNTTASAFYLKFYASTDTPVVGTTVPACTFLVPASTDTFRNLSIPVLLYRTLWLATTASAADSDSTAIGAGPIIQIFYE